MAESSKRQTSITGSYACYLTKEARLAVDRMVEEIGIDRDLAVMLLEQSWPETKVYSLEDTSDEKDDGDTAHE